MGDIDLLGGGFSCEYRGQIQEFREEEKAPDRNGTGPFVLECLAYCTWMVRGVLNTAPLESQA
jgi:hypothetical protein